MLKLKDFLVEYLMSTKIYEMADDRRRFADRIENLFQQICENITLIIYSFENNISEENRNHWLIELTTHIDALREKPTKVTKNRIFNDVIDSLNVDSLDKLKRTISNKFKKENFDTENISYDNLKKISYFLQYIVSKIACSKYSSSSKEEWFRETKEDIIEEIENIFGYSFE